MKWNQWWFGDLLSHIALFRHFLNVTSFCLSIMVSDLSFCAFVVVIVDVCMCVFLVLFLCFVVAGYVLLFFFLFSSALRIHLLYSTSILDHVTVCVSLHVCWYRCFRRPCFLVFTTMSRSYLSTSSFVEFSYSHGVCLEGGCEYLMGAFLFGMRIPMFLTLDCIFWIWVS